MTGQPRKDGMFALRLEVHLCISKVCTYIQFRILPCRNTYVKCVQLLPTAQAGQLLRA